MTVAAMMMLTMAASMGSFQSGVPSQDAVSLTSESPFTASVSFVGSDAGAKGSLYFMGGASDGTITSPSVMDDPELGMELFSTRTPPAGDARTVSLGTFDADEVLTFAYLITHGVRVAPTGSLFRTDLDIAPAHFAILDEPTRLNDDTVIYRLGVEDIRNPERADWDYNDVVFDVTITSVPTTGAPALAMALGLIVSRRRRRTMYS